MITVKDVHKSYTKDTETIRGVSFEIGKGTILELNNSEVSLTQAKLTYSQSIYNYLAAKADLDKVLGDE